ncbi:hypothetical protein [Pseudomonas helleri]|uniref:Uncharacterized protein n=1 Tax=Pseudomonas helleri TaxID=1608996 RepID=A0A7X1XHV0_9PSED|nr:hypothetical protein [Pseudomonas helleri]MQT91753.1 hypothetical protein [Pseudomonas helleri]MQT98443.1 hypothetical protein [Pseudomonas helleri]MQU35065.1 hypothetical protein [Pseudomonas helleri]
MSEAEKWEVIVNGVTVGSLSENELNQIDKHVQQDKRLYLAQFVNLIYIIWSAMSRAIHIAPLVVMTWAFGFACSDPEGFTTVITTNPAQVYIWAVLGALGASALAVFASAGFGFTRLNYENKFNARKEQLIRNLLKVPAKGDMALCKVVNESAVIA